MVGRIESRARWDAALARALGANLLYMELVGGDGTYAVSSSRDSEQGYLVTTNACTCPAGRNDDPVCAHRALVRALVGLLPLDPAPEPCRVCQGTGTVFNERYLARHPCDACQPLPDDRLAA